MLKEQNQDLLPQQKLSASVTDLYLSAMVYFEYKAESQSVSWYYKKESILKIYSHTIQRTNHD